MGTNALIQHFQTLARYNSIVNQRLYDACSSLSDIEYRKERSGSFGSIHRTLNHILLGDRIWMDRFEGAGMTTPPLHTILYEEFAALRDARQNEDARIEQFMTALTDEFLAPWNLSDLAVSSLLTQSRDYRQSTAPLSSLAASALSGSFRKPPRVV